MRHFITTILLLLALQVQAEDYELIAPTTSAVSAVNGTNIFEVPEGKCVVLYTWGTSSSAVLAGSETVSLLQTRKIYDNYYSPQQTYQKYASAVFTSTGSGNSLTASYQKLPLPTAGVYQVRKGATAASVGVYMSQLFDQCPQ